jgi:glycosyltransferase involved in cell wall biosynthesis
MRPRDSRPVREDGTEGDVNAVKIAMLSWESLHSPCVGGVGTHVSELALVLRRRGHEIHVFTRMSPGQRYYDLIEGVHYHRCPYAGLPDFVDDINNMCRAFVDRVFAVEDMQGPFDLIHAHDWLVANALIWIKQGRGRRTVLTIHSTEYARCGNAFPPGRSERIRAQERAGTYWADRVICVSGSTRDEVRWMYEVPDWKSHVIYNGVTPERFQGEVDVAATRRAFDLGPVDPVILFCGRIEWQKGPDLLLEAMPAVLREHANAKAVYMGDGGMRPGLEQRARQIDVAHAVRFLGRRNGAEIGAIYRISDGVCVPSRNEPFGIVILEAWSAGKPVVATDHGGAGEIVRHEHNGLRISPGADSIAWGINALFADFERARRMGRNGRDEIAARFTWDTVAEHTVDAYEMVVPRSVAARREPVDAIAAAAGAAVDGGRTPAPASQRRGDAPAHEEKDALETPAAV